MRCAAWRRPFPAAASRDPGRSRWQAPWPAPSRPAAPSSSKPGPAPASRSPTWCPSVLAGVPVVVATATKALQDQLATKDLPLLADTVEGGFSFAVLKGRSNYLCLQRVAEIGSRGETLELLPASADPPDADDPLTGRDGDDAGSTAIGEQVPGSSGGRGRPRPATGPSSTSSRTSGPGPRSSTTARECPGPFRCPSGHECFAEEARAAGGGGRRGGGEHPPLRRAPGERRGGAAAPRGGRPRRGPRGRGGDDRQPRRRDRARTLPGARRRPPVPSSTEPVPAGRVAADLVGELAALFARALEPFAGRRVPAGAVTGGGAEGVPEVGGRDGPALGEVVSLALGRLTDADRGTPARRSGGRGRCGGGPARPGAARGRAPGLRPHPAGRARRRRGRLGRRSVRARPPSGCPRSTWARSSPSGSGTPSPACSPRRPSRSASPNGWGCRNRRPTSSTSGARSTTSTTRCCTWPSRCPIDAVPSPNRPSTRSSKSLIEAAGGRTLALFTSWRAMRAAAEAVASRLPFPILSQSDLPKPALIEAFREREEACLFATLGFFQGVDLPGPYPQSGDDRPDPVSPARRPGARGPARSRRIGTPSRWWTCPEPARCSRRVPDG